MFTVPRSGRYLIKAWGARGGTHSYNYGENQKTYYGGRGAFKKGIFKLSKGTALNVVVGQKGGDSVQVKGGKSTAMTAAELGLSVEDNAGTGGGGGSFVYTRGNVLLLAAGGGGGASNGYNGVSGQSDASGTSSRGDHSSKAGDGGAGGQPGECNTAGVSHKMASDKGDNGGSGAGHHGGVGAGWLAQGCARVRSEHGEGGGSRTQFWVGGKAGEMNSGNNGGPRPGAVGGFGDAGGGAEDKGASGGGGGYSGGGSGTKEKQAGGGGGSYCSGTRCSGVTGGNLKDDGLVQIIELSD